MKYRLINTTSDGDMEDAVNTLLAEGWRPLGGPIVVPGKDAETHKVLNILMQAMILDQDLMSPLPPFKGGTNADQKAQT